MTVPEPKLSVCVNVRNPGQFFACCGLLELAHRLWAIAEGWFDAETGAFCLRAAGNGLCTLDDLVGELLKVEIEGDLTMGERNDLSNLERQKRSLAKERKTLSESDEARRSEFGKRLREGALLLGAPFNLRLDWWQEEGDAVPKTFAGRQEVLRMVRAMRAELPCGFKSDRPLEYRSLLKVVTDSENMEGGTQTRHGAGSKVEPFYFDAARFAHALDAGFSLDVQEKSLRATASPITELLALIGLQRFRPELARDWTFHYFTWHEPLNTVVAAAVASGAVPMAQARGYRFRLRFRDNQKRYKAFGFATAIGGA
jgi:CRISPR-associated protein Csb3